MCVDTYVYITQVFMCLQVRGVYSFSEHSGLNLQNKGVGSWCWVETIKGFRVCTWFSIHGLGFREFRV